MDKLPLSDATWDALVTAKSNAQWAKYGVFSSVAHQNYRNGELGSMLYVGKSLGPKAKDLNLSTNQQESRNGAHSWMFVKRYRPAFWQVAEAIESPERVFAWSNVCKMDSTATKPEEDEFKLVAGPCMQALHEEIKFYEPHVTMFVAGCNDYFSGYIADLLNKLMYFPHTPDCWRNPYACYKSEVSGRYAVMCRHPDWWTDQTEKQTVIQDVRWLLQHR